ncbi:diphosphoinositol polyphosphate phosphohydrolase 1-like [Convolutriloba macropyga]|uniref:diphosphoinositol polyphosphate phosphohydrolase 1-like n=1 Tax=Convolutriloba macropyga TaxID=536237 RepID=UPI003F51E36D
MNKATESKDHFRLRAGCICTKIGNSDEILLVESRKSANTWSFPGGGWEEELEETLQLAAKRELFEEAGCSAQFSRCMGVFKRGTRITFLFEGKITDNLDEWPEKSKRNRSWFPKSSAEKILKSPFERLILSWYRNAIEDSACISLKSQSLPAAVDNDLSEEPPQCNVNTTNSPHTNEFKLFPNSDGKLKVFEYTGREFSVDEEIETNLDKNDNWRMNFIGYVDVHDLTNCNFSSKFKNLVN